jgi:hypothetical protein
LFKQYGIYYAILKWCKQNDKYYSEYIVNSVISDYIKEPRVATKGDFALSKLKDYKKCIGLLQYRDKTFSDIEL